MVSVDKRDQVCKNVHNIVYTSNFDHLEIHIHKLKFTGNACYIYRPDVHSKCHVVRCIMANEVGT